MSADIRQRLTTGTSIVLTVDLSDLNKKIISIHEATGKAMKTLVKNAAINYAQTAAKWSIPEPGKAHNRLTNKSKKREIVSIGNSPPYWYHGQMRGGVWLANKQYSRGYMRALGIVKARKGVKWWDKKAGMWKVFGYFPGYTVKERLKIPHAGFGKLGWTHSAGWLGKGMAGILGAGFLLSSGKLNAEARMHNKINYASKVTPRGVLRQAKETAMHMLDKISFKKTIYNSAK